MKVTSVITYCSINTLKMHRLLIPVIVILAAAVDSQAGPGNSACAQWCAANFPNNAGSACTSPAAHGIGPCYNCGPLKTSPTKQLCSGVCRETSNDNNNCGSCGNQCGQNEQCQNGKCRPLPNCSPNNNQCGEVGCGTCGCGGGTACHIGQDNKNAGYCVFCAACSDVLQECSSNNDCPDDHSICVQTCCTGGTFTGSGGTARCIPSNYLKC
ncbi:hypothetical protein BDV27DRAFT_120076 [Aspergillus caelatus]|uniref:TNFR-Cys domain-containing protein n=2 Tax=Aspergillus subgen. Circumdati TaxID=2720871 RepID=A0A5N7AJF2_9EURO|nr:uncharacterized protein BDV27DRAFT_120076 [Aspergillus caelatus]KAE8369885.1 hypothetical protein BDV27DRAFT_120076 [Aspergillus caelatus]KAE8419475.1 hypothetical protein BDV36DRAFT_251118 [Aspergillus pseudocaelatus]